MRKELPSAALTAIAAVLAIPATYAVLRTYQVLFGAPEPNPAKIIWSAHIAMFWRLNIGALVAAMVAVGVYPIAKAHLAQTARVVGVCVVVIAAMIGIQGVLMP